LTDNKAVFVGVADKKTVFNVAYKDPKTHMGFAKRFVVAKFILDKEYRYFEENMNLEFISTHPEPTLEVMFIPKVNQKISKMDFSFKKVTLKGVTSKGIKIATRGVKKIRSTKDGN
jgi:topoisomerase-4 subunit A